MLKELLITHVLGCCSSEKRMRFAVTVCDWRFAVFDLQFAVYSFRLAACGLRFAVYGLRLAVSGSRFVVSSHYLAGVRPTQCRSLYVRHQAQQQRTCKELP